MAELQRALGKRQRDAMTHYWQGAAMDAEPVWEVLFRGCLRVHEFTPL